MKRIILFLVLFLFITGCSISNEKKSPNVQKISVKEVKKIVDTQYDLARQLLTDNKDMLEYIAKQLLEKETLDEKEFEALMRDVRIERGEIVEDVEEVLASEENQELTDSQNNEENIAKEDGEENNG